MKRCIAGFVGVTAMALATPTFAQDDAPAPQSVPAPESESESEAAPAPLPVPPPARRGSVGVNPLAFLLGRFGGDAERLLAGHVGLVGNLHFDVSAVLTSTSTNPYRGFGGEAGLRLYSSPDSVFGFFMGPSLLAGWYSVTYYGNGLSLPDVGFAVDLGGKARVGDRGFVTLGAGMQHLTTPAYPRDVDGIVSFVLGPGWAPRLLLTAGTSFR